MKVKQPPWPRRSDGSHCLRPRKIDGPNHPTPLEPEIELRDFSSLPYDALARIAASFGASDLRSASLVCRPWREALRPLREAAILLRRGKKLKHRRGDLEKALETFLAGAIRGSTMAMVDAGLIYWQTGRKRDALVLYRRAAELGDSAGQFNFGVSCLQAEPPNLGEAVRWLYKSALGGHVRAQYQLALSLHGGHGVDRNMEQAARWYLKAAEGGCLRAMYNISLCYKSGEGVSRNHRRAKKWMKRAADRGHTRAQVEHGIALFSEGEMLKAFVYLELANRGGETTGSHVKNVILQKLSAASRDRARLLADTWRISPSIS